MRRVLLRFVGIFKEMAELLTEYSEITIISR